MDTQDIRRILDQIDEVIYISDLNTYEMLYLNRYGVAKFGGFKLGVKCYDSELINETAKASGFAES